MKNNICLFGVMTTALVAIHAIMIKRAIKLEQKCGCLSRFETYDC